MQKFYSGGRGLVRRTTGRAEARGTHALGGTHSPRSESASTSATASPPLATALAARPLCDPRFRNRRSWISRAPAAAAPSPSALSSSKSASALQRLALCRRSQECPAAFDARVRHGQCCTYRLLHPSRLVRPNLRSRGPLPLAVSSQATARASSPSFSSPRSPRTERLAVSIPPAPALHLPAGCTAL